VLLRLPYLGLSGVFAFVRLLPMSGTDKDIEILALRRQLAVLQRHIDRPRITSTDRAFLAALLHRLPRVRLRELHLIVSPDTILRWHRDLIVLCYIDTSCRHWGQKPSQVAMRNWSSRRMA
jgi:putative transposase